MKKLLVLLIACLALTVTACGDDDDDDGGGSSGGATTTEQTDTGTSGGGAEDGAAGPVSIDIIDNDYDPADETVPAGTTVTWTNTGQAPHTVTKDGGAGPDFDSGTIDPGDTFEQTFNDAGTIDYICTIHPGQAGSITVE